MMTGFSFYWMANKEWFYFDDEIGIPHLTDKATPEAMKSFEEYQKILKWSKEHPNILK